MKKSWFMGLILAGAAGLLLTGCLASAGWLASTYTVGTDIADADITGFYYTYSRTYENAYYQRYRFYVEDGAHYFFHETREAERPGFLTEENATRLGTMPLTEKEWQSFLTHIRGGTVQKKKDDVSAGGAGPWEYLYWNGDRGMYREYHFPSREEEKAFVTFCETLREESGT